MRERTTVRASTSARHPGRAIAAIAATYFFFLIFAEFSFLNVAARHVTGATALRAVLGALGASGILGAALAARYGKTSSGINLLAWEFRGCALGGGLALLAANELMLVVVAIIVGCSLGALTVTLATRLRDAIGQRRLALCVGAGTGLAYAASNLPWVFYATADLQAWLAAGAALAASFIKLTPHAKPEASASTSDLNRPELVRWIIVLLALVWLDSAAFYIIQHTESLRASTWTGSATLLENAAIHLIAALVAGVLLDRGKVRKLVALLALASLVVAALVLSGALAAHVPAHWAYTAGVSLYSVIMVEYPARSGRPGVAALVFAIAGWAGSALGIGMAQDLAAIPSGFIAAAAVVGAMALLSRRSGPTLATTIIVLVVALSSAHADDAELGREVYIAEGCIHCHSQYIRPRVASEVLNWGPATTLADAVAARPPLFGTRRQGPDLSHVGNRRSPEWNRLHLIDPQKISPGSRMPSYAHLFADNNKQGAALVAYLSSLGADSIAWRRERAAAWQPSVKVVVDRVASARLFSRNCAQCHGPDGKGNTSLSSHLTIRPPDWTADAWRHVRAEENVILAVSRMIKFGLPGSAMAGHEYLPDAEIVGLAEYVRYLHKDDGGRSSVVIRP